MMRKKQGPFRYDYVGSFLRPAVLKEARENFKKGKITKEQLTAVEDEEIRKLVQKQKAAGYHAITDGEFRRSYWHLDFMWGFCGIQEIELDHGYFFHGEETTHGSIEVTGKISGENHPFVEHFKFLKQLEDETVVARQTMPAPAQLLAEFFREDNGKKTVAVYPDEEELIQDIAAAYRTVIRELYEAGCRNIQFDDCTWGMFCDTKYWSARQKENVSLEEEAEKYLRLNNLAIEGKPEDIILPGQAVVDMHQLRHSFLQKRMLMHIIWSLMTSVPEILNHFNMFLMIKKWFWGWLLPNRRCWKRKKTLLQESMRQKNTFL